jgi:hypothetical protein
MDRIVHVCNGDATADALSLADLPGDIRVWGDALDRGPLVLGDDPAEYAARAEYWAAHALPGAGDRRPQLAAWDAGVDEARGADELILWFAHGLADQLALVRLLARLARRGLPTQLTIVSIDRHPDAPTFAGFADLAPEQLAALWPRRAALARDAVDEANAAWIATTAADPRALPLLLRRVKALPFLAGAIERHLEELPDPAGGLSRTERAVLAAIARGEAPLAASLRAQDPRYAIDDALVAATVAVLARARLVEGTAITAVGRQALAGGSDRVHDAGIDDWRGGVRLSGRGPVWRWEARERRLVER